MSYILIWLGTVFSSKYLFSRAAGTLSILRPNIHLLIFYYSFFLSSLIGALLIVLRIDDSYIIKKLLFDSTREKAFFLILAASILLPLAMCILSRLIGFDSKRESLIYWSKKVMLGTCKAEKRFFLLLCIATVICMLAVIYTLVKTGKVPILQIFSQADDTTAGELRQLAKVEYKGNPLIKNIIALGLTSILSIVAYICASTSNYRGWRILFLLLLPFAIIVNIYDLQKGPILFYFLMLLIASVYVGKLKINLRLGIMASLFVLCYIALAYSYTSNTMDNYLSYSRGPVGRVILTQIAPTFLYVDRYGTVYPFLEEKGLPSLLLQLYDIDQVRSARVLMEDLFPEKVAQGTAGVLNSLYIGEGYSSYGVIGVVISSLLLGFFIQYIYIHFMRLPKHPIFLALFIYFVVQIPRALVGGFIDILFNPLWVILYIFCTSLYFFANKLNRT